MLAFLPTTSLNCRGLGARESRCRFPPRPRSGLSAVSQGPQRRIADSNAYNGTLPPHRASDCHSSTRISRRHRSGTCHRNGGNRIACMTIGALRGATLRLGNLISVLHRAPLTGNAIRARNTTGTLLSRRRFTGTQTCTNPCWPFIPKSPH